jgi:molecular chaperone DnaK (HSP70)
VLATGGDTHLGGDDIDLLLMHRVLAQVGWTQSAERIQEIRKAVIRRSGTSPSAETAGSTAPFTREEFDALIRPIVDRTLEPCRQALADAKIDTSQIDEVVLVGGSTRIPLVRRLVGELFGRTPHSGLNPDEVVALGAAVAGGHLVSGSREMLLLDVTPLSLGIETLGGVVSRSSSATRRPGDRQRDVHDRRRQPNGVDIHVLQGERELVDDNRSLARFKLRGIPPMPAGLPRVQSVQIDASGILGVTARASHRHRADDRGEAVVRPDGPGKSSGCCSNRSSTRRPILPRAC